MAKRHHSKGAHHHMEERDRASFGVSDTFSERQCMPQEVKMRPMGEVHEGISVENDRKRMPDLYSGVQRQMKEDFGKLRRIITPEKW